MNNTQAELEAASKYQPEDWLNSLAIEKAFLSGIEYQKRKSFSREDMYKLFWEFNDGGMLGPYIDKDFENYIKENYPSK